MLGSAVLQALLVARRVTFEQTKRPVLLLAAPSSASGTCPSLRSPATRPSTGSTAGSRSSPGIGFIAVSYGFLAGGERHPLSAIGGVVLLASSTAFLAILGVRLVTRDLVVPAWNL